MPTRHPHTSRRRGFTLVELLGVILIIAILVALLTPAVMSGIRSARVAQVKTEMSQLQASLTEFKAKYGTYPPSRITLHEDGTGWSAADMAALRGVFGTQFNFGIARDINGDGDMTDALVLTGSECLVFFLGGLAMTDGTNPLPTMMGFSNNPADPFSRAGSNRVGPFYEFRTDRLVIPTSGNRMPVYVDPLPGQQFPYIYLSSYDGSGYRTADLPASTLSNFYRQHSATGPGHNAKTFQLISPGADGSYGTGGVYDPNKIKTQLVGAREPERDNITNFKDGLLGD